MSMSTGTVTAVDDRYPTRLNHAIAPLPREDPVVWGEESDGPLRRHELDGFDEHGYLVRPATLGEHLIAPLRGELDRIAADLAPGDPRTRRLDPVDLPAASAQ
jgi:ectoine hydroxylase